MQLQKKHVEVRTSDGEFSIEELPMVVNRILLLVEKAKALLNKYKAVAKPAEHRHNVSTCYGYEIRPVHPERQYPQWQVYHDDQPAHTTIFRTRREAREAARTLPHYPCRNGAA